ncbi:type II toxin-antitoxin system RelE/ParE family toxin [Granulosicoccus sp.]|nr:type II toxin-antitoxin system RelE/ParE family toxin [Granulosicoccus sp.]MDB4223363.1 type II toxin-antitoxin system RelE/ParE family toxin [Granulosicoccus sp.]
MKNFQYFIAAFPESGDLIKGAGGIRKVRWGSKGQGKRGGVRVIYFYIKPDAQVLLLDIYGKNVKETISSKELNKLLELLK